jgi:hypothetical protein
MARLIGKVAAVTGASRGSAWSSVARGPRAPPSTSPHAPWRQVSTFLRGTDGERAAEVDRRGGKALAVQVDHSDDARAEALLSARQGQPRAGLVGVLNPRWAQANSCSAVSDDAFVA